MDTAEKPRQGTLRRDRNGAENRSASRPTLLDLRRRTGARMTVCLFSGATKPDGAYEYE
jgi:hypothetical protein